MIHISNIYVEYNFGNFFVKIKLFSFLWRYEICLLFNSENKQWFNLHDNVEGDIDFT